MGREWRSTWLRRVPGRQDKRPECGRSSRLHGGRMANKTDGSEEFSCNSRGFYILPSARGARRRFEACRRGRDLTKMRAGCEVAKGSSAPIQKARLYIMISSHSE